MPMPVFDKDDKMQLIEVDEVFCVFKEEKSRQIKVTAECGDYYLPSSIKQIADIMKAFGFLQIDKNRVINVYRIKSIVENVITVDGSDYAVSRRQLKILKEMLSNYRPQT